MKKKSKKPVAGALLPKAKKSKGKPCKPVDGKISVSASPARKPVKSAHWAKMERRLSKVANGYRDWPAMSALLSAIIGEVINGCAPDKALDNAREVLYGY